MEQRRSPGNLEINNKLKIASTISHENDSLEAMPKKKHSLSLLRSFPWLILLLDFNKLLDPVLGFTKLEVLQMQRLLLTLFTVRLNEHQWNKKMGLLLQYRWISFADFKTKRHFSHKTSWHGVETKPLLKLSIEDLSRLLWDLSSSLIIVPYCPSWAWNKK